LTIRHSRGIMQIQGQKKRGEQAWQEEILEYQCVVKWNTHDVNLRKNTVKVVGTVGILNMELKCSVLNTKNFLVF